MVLATSLLASVVAVGVTAAAPAGVAAATTPWYQTSLLELRLINCDRTGGWVLSNGTCVGYGSGTYSPYVAPLKYSAGISAVSRSWARYLAATNTCTHGNPGARLRRSGYRSWRWGENIGCGAGYASMYQFVLATHLRFQAEKATNGGHWQAMKNPAFTMAGVGLARYGSRMRLVVDFYRP
jgi:hypothetical protein